MKRQPKPKENEAYTGAGRTHPPGTSAGVSTTAFRLRDASFTGEGLRPHAASKTWADVLAASYQAPRRERRR